MSKRGPSRQITRENPEGDDVEEALEGKQTSACSTSKACRVNEGQKVQSSAAAAAAAAAASGGFYEIAAQSSGSVAAAATPSNCAHLVALPQVLIQSIMRHLDCTDKLHLASQSKSLRAAAAAGPIAWLDSAPVSLSVERILSPAFHRSVFRFAPWRILHVNWCIPNESGVEAALARVKRVLEVQLGSELGGNMQWSSSHDRLPQQELFWPCVRTAPALQTLNKLVVCSSLAPADLCIRLAHLSALHTLHVDAGYDRTGSPPEDQLFSLSGVDQLPALTDLSYPEPRSTQLVHVAKCANLHKLCVLDLAGSAKQLRQLLASPGLMRVNRLHLGFCCGYDVSNLMDVVRGLPNLVTLTVMSEFDVELLRTLSDCPRLTHVLLQGSDLGCHVFGNILKRLKSQYKPVPRISIQVEQITHESCERR